MDLFYRQFYQNNLLNLKVHLSLKLYRLILYRSFLVFAITFAPSTLFLLYIASHFNLVILKFDQSQVNLKVTNFLDYDIIKNFPF